jgi:beta-galactosidase
MSGNTVNEGQILSNAYKTDGRKWNKQAEEIKTAATLRSENEQKTLFLCLIFCKKQLYLQAITKQ